jgi:hypothetical protein
MSELRPCPFCGGSADYYIGGGGYLQCEHCLATIPYEHGLPYDEGKQRAIKKWNARNQPNEPLTLEQLKDMQGEPVYIVPITENEIADWEKHWSILKDGRVTATSMTVRGRMYFHYLKDYGKTWLAYAHKPESEG